MATKTNSLVDRLRTLTVPPIDDVRAGLAGYIGTTAQAGELAAKIERTDDLLNDFVSKPYGWTDDEGSCHHEKSH
ncbi:restriction endonuclease [Haloarcula vallismortis]|nr:restriction endonuclease [Haloarcula vallismortis]